MFIAMGNLLDWTARAGAKAGFSRCCSKFVDVGKSEVLTVKVAVRSPNFSGGLMLCVVLGDIICYIPTLV
jgi:hypothetical protein